MKTLISVTVLLLIGLTTSPAAQEIAGTTSVVGVREEGSIRSLVHARVVVRDDSDPATLTEEALKSLDARPLRPDEMQSWGFALQGGRWGQFSTPGRNDDKVVQYYNPAGAPIADAVDAILVSTQRTWTEVRSSRFRFEFGGLTTRAAAAGDGFNDVEWQRRTDTRALAVTTLSFNVITGAYVDADVWLNSRYWWTTAPAPPPPPPTLPKDAARTSFVIIPLRFDVETILVHEEGHVLGLGHVYDRSAVMYPFVGPEVAIRDLGDGDIAGVTALYPRQPLRPISRRDPSAGYRRIATAFDLIPTGMARWSAFEPGGLNDRGDVSFSADLIESCDPGACVETYGQGVFLAGNGPIRQVARTDQAVPGANDVLRLGVLGASALNARGDVAFAFSHAGDFDLFGPWGFGTGVYRYNFRKNDLDPLAVPFSTPAERCPPAFSPEEPPCLLEGGHHAAINDRGDVAFAAMSNRWWMTETMDGVYMSWPDGDVHAAVVPGDPAPGNGVFVNASMPSLNNAGDVAFEGHVDGEPCSWMYGFRCLSGLYVRHADSGSIDPVVLPGDPLPGGGAVFFAGGPAINSRGDVLFAASLGREGRNYGRLGLYLSANGTLEAIVRPGDEMPGGGRLLTASLAVIAGPVYSLSDNGLIAFNATLDTDEDEDGVYDTGVYLWHDGELTLVARSGTTIPGAGVVWHVQDWRIFGSRQSHAGAIVNNRGQVLFQAILQDGSTVLLIAENRDE